MKKFMIDVDGTICNSTYGEYEKAIPYTDRINYINQLYEQGHHITYWTARGANTGLDWWKFTEKQLQHWGCKYDVFRCDKPAYDVWVDDKAFDDRTFFGVSL